MNKAFRFYFLFFKINTYEQAQKEDVYAFCFGFVIGVLFFFFSIFSDVLNDFFSCLVLFCDFVFFFYNCFYFLVLSAFVCVLACSFVCLFVWLSLFGYFCFVLCILHGESVNLWIFG